MTFIRRFIIVWVIIAMTACGTSDENTFQKQSALKFQPIPQQWAEKAEESAKSVEEVKDAQAVSKDKDVYIYVNVEGFDRLFLKDIRSKAERKIEKDIPGSKVQLSTDKKVDLEIKELKEELKRRELGDKQLDKKLKKIEKDMKG